LSTPEPDWDALRTAAREAMTHAYAPYSRFPVGVAGLVDDGRVVTGCNVENASYGLGLCAECGMVSDLARTGGGRLVAVACVGGDRAFVNRRARFASSQKVNPKIVKLRLTSHSCTQSIDVYPLILREMGDVTATAPAQRYA